MLTTLTANLAPKEALSTREIHEKYGWSKSHVYSLIHSGRLKTIKSGRSYRVTRASLEAYIAANTMGE